MGVYFLRAYLKTQALALPLLKDKQRKPAHAERLYLRIDAIYIISLYMGNLVEI